MKIKEILINILKKGRSWLLYEIKEDNKIIHTKIDKLEKDFVEMQLNQLRMLIVANETPIEEKLVAGKIYIERGGNGQIKTYYKHLEEEYLKKLSGEK